MDLNDLSPDAIIKILTDPKIRKQANPSERFKILIKNSLSRTGVANLEGTHGPPFYFLKAARALGAGKLKGVIFQGVNFKL